MLQTMILAGGSSVELWVKTRGKRVGCFRFATVQEAKRWEKTFLRISQGKPTAFSWDERPRGATPIAREAW